MAVDALAASPFALLDKRGSLRFVTDVVHEDDALYLARVHTDTVVLVTSGSKY
jgi:hypothetical protein